MPRDLLGTWKGFWGRPAADRGVVRKHQEDRLRLLVEHAWLNVPYYRRRFEQAGLRPADIRSLGDLPLIPISRKADFRLTSFNDRIASGINPDRCVRRVTAGSTGEPTHLLRTRYEEYLLFAYRQRVGRYAGVRLWEKRAAVMNGEKPATSPTGSSASRGSSRSTRFSKSRRSSDNCVLTGRPFWARLRRTSNEFYARCGRMISIRFSHGYWSAVASC